MIKIAGNKTGTISCDCGNGKFMFYGGVTTQKLDPDEGTTDGEWRLLECLRCGTVIEVDMIEERNRRGLQI